jgi:hypothetical protein
MFAPFAFFSLNLSGNNSLIMKLFVTDFLMDSDVFLLQNNLDELFMLMHFLDAGKVSLGLLTHNLKCLYVSSKKARVF